MEEFVLICEDTFDGVFTAIYEAYQLRKNENIESHDLIHISVKEPDNYKLFMHYIKIETDMEKSQKVSRTIKRELGEEVFYQLCLALAAECEGKADAVYHTIVLGLKYHDRRILDRMHEDAVSTAFACQRSVKREIQHLEGFLRFEELEQEILYARFAPTANLLTFLMPHFADRLPSQNFIIYDEKRQICGLHPKYKQWYLVSGTEIDTDKIVFSTDEKIYSELFKHFCKAVAIEERTNPELQMNMLPKKFRPYMTEFNMKRTSNAQSKDSFAKKC